MNRSSARFAVFSRRTIAVIGAIAVLLCIPQIGGKALAGNPDAVRMAWQKAIDSGGYRFEADIDQTLIPLASKDSVGARDTRIGMSAQGAVRVPDQADVRIVIEDQPQLATVGLVLDDGKTYLRRGDDLSPVQSPAGSASPSGDYLGFLSAATDVHELDSEGSGAEAGWRRYAFDIDGARLADQIKEQMQKDMAGKLPAGVRVAPVTVLGGLSGSGVVWVDETGFPRRQLLDLEIPRASASHAASVHVETDFRDFGNVESIGRVVEHDDGHWTIEPAAAPAAMNGPAAAPAAAHSAAYSAPALSVASNGAARIATAKALVESAVRSAGDNAADLAPLLALLAMAALSAVFYHARRKPATYALITVVTVLAMTVGPMVQYVGVEWFFARQARATEAPTLADALSAPAAASATNAPASTGTDASALVAAQAASNEQHIAQSGSATNPAPGAASCGAGSRTADPDGDGLPDFDEGCIGTDPYRSDSDGDGVSDGTELAGFTLGDQTWYANPLSADTNSDGSDDGTEWPAPVGRGQRTDADGSGTATDDEAWDPDSDAVPNIWDDDDDGDDVPDELDLSQFSRVPFHEYYAFSVEGAPGHQYIDLQVQPEETDHLRYSATPLNWPDDERGQITDLDGSTDDVRLMPLLELKTFTMPSIELARNYGVATVLPTEDSVDQRYSLYAPLLPVESNGKIVAFSARLGYGPDEFDSLAMTARMVWGVRGNVDVGTRDGFVSETLPLHLYREASIRVTGLSVVRSDGFDSAIFGTPDTPADDRTLFNLLFGLKAAYLDQDGPDLTEIATRLSLPLTPLEEKWGVSGRVVADQRSYPHRDEGLADMTTRRTPELLAANYAATDTPALAIAYESTIANYNLDDQNVLEADYTSVNLAAAPLVRMRGVQLAMYEASGPSWQALSLDKVLDTVDARHQDVTASLAALQATYPDLVADDLRSVVRQLYAIWNTGQLSILTADGVSLSGEAVSDADITARVQSSDQDLSAYLIEIGHFAQPGAGLLVGQGGGLDWDFARARTAEMNTVGVNAVGFTVYEFGGATDPEIERYKKTKDVVMAVRTIVQLLDRMEKARRGLTMGQRALQPLVRAGKLEGRTFGAVGVVLAVGIIWTTFALTTDFSNEIAMNQAIATAVVATVFAVAMFIVSLNPIGLVLVTLFYLVDLIVFLATEGEFSLTDQVIGLITTFFYDVNILTEITDAHFTGFHSGLAEPERGLVSGSRFLMTDEVGGTVIKKGGSSRDLLDSYVEGRLEASASVSVTVASLNEPHSCHFRSPDNTTLDCANVVGAEFQLDNAGRDIVLSVSPRVALHVFYEECTLAGLECFRKSFNRTLPEDPGEPSEIELDVLPADLDDLWAWQPDLPTGHTFNPDPDGDRLFSWPPYEVSSSDCVTIGTGCTVIDQWDTDGDGASDGFEVLDGGDLGLIAWLADTDSDGLGDTGELRVGTRPAVADTDGDGLSDGDEQFQPGEGLWPAGMTLTATGGWVAYLPSGRQVPVFSDPLRDDADRDGITDAAERANLTSPYAPNRGPRLTLSAAPAVPDNAPLEGVVLTPGTSLDLGVELLAVGAQTIDTPLELCLPSWLTGITGGTLVGSRQPAMVASSGCGDDAAATKLVWSFTGADALPVGSVVSTTLRATAAVGMAGSVAGRVTGRLAYHDGLDHDGDNVIDDAVLLPSIPVAVDFDYPTVLFSSPQNGSILGGGTNAVVLGGSATDGTSWVTGVEVQLPGGGRAAATGEGPWAYTWSAPGDGVHTLSATATDFVGWGSTPAETTITIDNTPPSAAISSPTANQVVTDPGGTGATIVVSGTVTDGLTGVTRVQVRVDDRPWRAVDLINTNRNPYPTSAGWQFDWRLPSGDAAQGRHTVAARAFDRAGNPSVMATRDFVVDAVAPADGLVTSRFASDPPAFAAGAEVTLRGLANDAGNVPAPSHPSELIGVVDALADATTWLSPASIDEDDAGVSVTWLGNFDGDRLADAAIGLPAAAGGDGRVTVVNGRAGDWTVPPLADVIAGARTAYVGLPDAGIGGRVAAVGDVNGDGLDDMVIADPAGEGAQLVFGQMSAPGGDVLLDGSNAPERTLLRGQVDTAAAAGDVNGDGLDDVLLGTAGPPAATWLLLGKTASSWHAEEDVAVQAAAVIAAGPPSANAIGVGDMDGDGRSEFALGDPTGVLGAPGGVWVFRGTAVLSATGARQLDAASAAVRLSGANAGDRMAAPGDVNGDDRADLLFSDGAAPKLAFGAATGTASCCLSLAGYSPAASGFLAAVGNVDGDAGGVGDMLIGAADGSGYFIAGQAGLNVSSPRPQITAQLAGVAGAASISIAAGGDANADGSSDLLLVPAATGAAVLETAQISFGEPNHVPASSLPLAGGRSATAGKSAAGHSAAAGKSTAGSPLDGRADDAELLQTGTDRYVDDDWAGTTAGADPDGAGPAGAFGTASFGTIQTAVAAAGAGDTIHVLPGLYQGFEVGSGKNGLAIEGSDADAVFVSGADRSGVTAAVYVHNSTGVRVSSMTLRDAQRGVWLAQAGVGGYTSAVAGYGNASLRTRLEHLLAVGCDVGLYTDRTSAVRLSDSTLVASDDADRAVSVQGAADASLAPAWSSTPTDATSPGISDGGGIAAGGGQVQLIAGGNSRNSSRYDPATNAWSSGPSTGYDVRPGSAVAYNDRTEQAHRGAYALTGRDDWRPAFDYYGFETTGPDDLPQIRSIEAIDGSTAFIGGSFFVDVLRQGQFGQGYDRSHGIAKYSTSGWVDFVGELRCGQSGDWWARCGNSFGAVHDMVLHNGKLYVTGAFDQIEVTRGGLQEDFISGANFVAYYDTANDSWHTMGTGLSAHGDAITVDGSGNVYVAGQFAQAGGITVNGIAKWNGSAWSGLTPSGGQPGLRLAAGGLPEVNSIQAVAISGVCNGLLVGGTFDSTPLPGVACWNGTNFTGPGGGWASGAHNVYSIATVGNDVFVYDRGWVRMLRSGVWSDLTSLRSIFTNRTHAIAAGPGGKLYVPVCDVNSWDGVGGTHMATFHPATNTYGTFGGGVRRTGWDCGGQVTAIGFLNGEPLVGGFIDRIFNGPDAGLLGTGESETDTTTKPLVILGSTNALVRVGGTAHRVNYIGAPTTGSMLTTGEDGWMYINSGGSNFLVRYNPATSSTQAAALLSEYTGQGATMQWVDGRGLFVLPGDTPGDNTASFYFTSGVPNIQTWGTQLALDYPRAPVPFDIGAGASLAWDGGEYLYLLQGGNGRKFARYNIPSGDIWTAGDPSPWEVLSDSLGGIRFGGGLVKLGATLYAARGNGTAFDGFGPIGIDPVKLLVDNVAIVAPGNSASATWLAGAGLSDEPADYHLDGTGSQWVGAPAISWTPSGAAAPLTIATLDTASARFVEPERGLYRVRTGTGLTAGYHDARPDVHVFTSEAACTRCTLLAGDPNRLTWGDTAYGSIQEAIDTGALRVLVHAGVFAEPFNLVSGVDVVGAGASLTVVTPLIGGGTSSIAKAEGVRRSTLARVTLAGTAATDGMRIEDGAQSVRFARSVVRGARTGISLSGAAVDAEIVNNTIVRNGAGLAATACASVDVRNTIFADQTATALAYESCAAQKLHRYNLYFGNGSDLAISGTPTQAPGPEEVFADPLFVDPDATVNDFRLDPLSPAVDAGSPGDPVPPSTGDRVDIGYVESHSASFFASGDYCEFCENDGLFWGADAFNSVSAALGAAATEVEALGCGGSTLGGVPCGSSWTVGVAPGQYAEHVIVPSHVRLVGSGAEQTTIDGAGTGYPVRLLNAVGAEVTGLRITGAGATAAGVLVDGASNGVTVSRSLITGNGGDGVRFATRSSGEVSFVTVADNTGAGLHATDPKSWLLAQNSIVARNGVGLSTSNGGQVFDDFNLVHLNTTQYQDGASTGLVAGPNTLVGRDPLFAAGGYSLQGASPARDAADPLSDAPVGGGARADMGFDELVGVPLALWFGREGVSAATGNSGIQAVEFGIRHIADPTTPLTSTASLPESWQPATLATPGQTGSYWDGAVTPASGNGLYRVYSRATDLAGNTIHDAATQYRGSFLVDGSSPAVTPLEPLTGASVMSPVEMRAEVADYEAGRFQIEEVAFEVDGQRQPASWAAEPWDPSSGDARRFRLWATMDTGAHTVRAIATDRAGQETATGLANITITGVRAPDTQAPTVAVVAPADGSAIRTTTVFTGTVADTGGSGVASVELSLDGGRTWSPVEVDGSRWQQDWATPDDQEHVSYPVRVRARDRAGNTSPAASLAVTVDNVAPTGVVPVTLELPEGTHTDSFTEMDVAWSPAVDGSADADVLLAVDQLAETSPSTVVSGTSATAHLNAPGEWYVHLAAQDAAGNAFLHHFGPWHVGTTGEPGSQLLSGLLGGANTVLACPERRQTIAVDGTLEVDLHEWNHDTEHLADDPRSGANQALYVTWDGAYTYLGWKGARWQIDGTLYAYFDLAGGGTTTPITDTLGLPSSPQAVALALPIEADFAVAVDGPEEGALYRWDGAAWTVEAVDEADLLFSQGEGGDTEIRLPWGASTYADLRLFAVAVSDTGVHTAVFPTTNQTDGPWGSFYEWTDRCNSNNPASDVATARLARVTLASPQSEGAVWGSGSELTFQVAVENPEPTGLHGARLSIESSGGLGFETLTGVPCTAGCDTGDSSWTISLPDIAAGGRTEITIGGHLGDVTGMSSVTTIASLELPTVASGASALQGQLVHRIDSLPPLVSLDDPSGSIGSGAQLLFGSADDGDGIGVAAVEYRLDGGPWVPASGASLFGLEATPGAGATSLTVDVRARDAYGLESETVTRELAVDGVAPDATMVVPAVLVGAYAVLTGTAVDPSPEGGPIDRVEVQILEPGADPDTSPWTTGAILYGGDGGARAWSFTWALPAVQGESYVVRARAVDAAGNVGAPTQLATTTVFEFAAVEAGDDQAVDEGEAAVLAGHFLAFAGPDAYDIVWEFGDGTEARSVVTSTVVGEMPVTATHHYADDGSYQVALRVTNGDVMIDDGLSVSVSNTAPVVDAGADVPGLEGTAVTVVPATFVDAGTLDTHTAAVDWGDGSPAEEATVDESPYGPPGSDEGATGTATLPSHTYLNEGSYDVTVCVTDDDDEGTDGGRDCDEVTVSVANDVPALDDDDLMAFEDEPTSIEDLPFTDAGTADEHTATVDWGDGSPVEPATMGGTDSRAVILPQHTFVQPGIYEASACVSDGVDTGCATLRISVVHAALRFAALATRQTDRVQVQDADVSGSVAAAGVVDAQSGALIAGNAVSFGAGVSLAPDSEVTGSVWSRLLATLGPRSRVRSHLVGRANAELKPNARVDGDVTVAGTLTINTGASVGGAVSQGATVAQYPALAAIQVQVTPGTSDVAVPANGSLTLAPGSYKNLAIGKSATVRLRAGTYAFANVTAETSARIDIDLDPDGNGEAQALIVGVAGNLVLKSGTRMTVVSSVGGPEDVLVRVAGQSLDAQSGSVVIGTYLAPSAVVKLQSNAALTGMIYGAGVQILKGARVTWAPALEAFAATGLSVFSPSAVTLMPTIGEEEGGGDARAEVGAGDDAIDASLFPSVSEAVVEPTP